MIGKSDQAALAAYHCESFFLQGRGEVFTLQMHWLKGSGTIVFLKDEWDKLPSADEKVKFMRKKINELYSSLPDTHVNPGP